MLAAHIGCRRQTGVVVTQDLSPWDVRGAQVAQADRAEVM
jgi:hypothetical protein